MFFEKEMQKQKKESFWVIFIMPTRAPKTNARLLEHSIKKKLKFYDKKFRSEFLFIYTNSEGW